MLTCCVFKENNDYILIVRDYFYGKKKKTTFHKDAIGGL